MVFLIARGHSHRHRCIKEADFRLSGKSTAIQRHRTRTDDFNSNTRESAMSNQRKQTARQRVNNTAVPGGGRTNNHQQQQRQPMRPAPRPGPAGGGDDDGRAADGNDTGTFLAQLQQWAQHTVQREQPELEAEFTHLQRMPKPEPSPEFVRHPQLNRYRDVPCVENNRVQLHNGHYIHANWIDGNGERRFMCTQGPMPAKEGHPGTVDDFWTMVVQERIDAIVMLCDTVELNRPKCAQYWPTEESPNSIIQSSDGNLRVAFMGEEKLDNHLFKTRLHVTQGKQQPMIVRHFHWRKWPDRGVPTNHLAALRLLHYLGNYKRVLVHCSAGIGRTGTIVAIYLAQNQMRVGQPLDIQELVQRLRQQRAGSVQSLDQFLYIYSVLLRYAKNKADRGHIQLDTERAERLIQAISRRIYRS